MTLNEERTRRGEVRGAPEPARQPVMTRLAPTPPPAGAARPYVELLAASEAARRSADDILVGRMMPMLDAVDLLDLGAHLDRPPSRTPL
jgi:hypothetical protein